MRILPTANQMRNAEQYTIEKVGIPSSVLMERAALGIVDVMKREGIDLTRVLILCGSGNNGGDGFAVSRLLHQLGHSVALRFVGDTNKMTEECKLQMNICKNLCIDVGNGLEDIEELDALNFTAIIDGIFGIGLTRLVSEKYLEIIRKVKVLRGAQVVAIDIPSGVCATTAKCFAGSLGAIQADLTIAIQCEKLGTILFPGARFSGKVVTIDIGIQTIGRQRIEGCDFVNQMYTFGDEHLCYTYDREDVKTYMPKRVVDSHKGDYGKVLVIAGSAGMSGAAFLCSRAAYGVGAGVVKIYTPTENRSTLQTLLPESIVVAYDQFDSRQLDELLEWADVVCIGCGLGKSSLSEEILIHTLKKVNCPIVIDADGINLLKNHKELLGELEHPCILTPHIKEMANFTDLTIKDLKENPVKCARDFAKSYPVICVMKDARTVVSLNERHTFINTSGNNAMAKGGAGDVLAGVITGLIGISCRHGEIVVPALSDDSAFLNATFGVFLHGLGGDMARDKKGSHSVLPRDIITGIEEVLAQGE